MNSIPKKVSRVLNRHGIYTKTFSVTAVPFSWTSRQPTRPPPQSRPVSKQVLYLFPSLFPSPLLLSSFHLLSLSSFPISLPSFSTFFSLTPATSCPSSPSSVLPPTFPLHFNSAQPLALFTSHSSSSRMVSSS